MSPWLRSHKTNERMSIIIRNELYNAHGAVTDKKSHLSFVSPCSIEQYPSWDGFLFGELEASFIESRQYHAIGLFCVRAEDRERLKELAEKAQEKAKEQDITYVPLKFKMLKKTTIFEVMTGSTSETVNQDDEDEVDGNIREIRNESIGPISDDMDQAGSGHRKSFKRTDSVKSTVKESLQKFCDLELDYCMINMPELDVEFSYSPSLKMKAKLKLRRVIRYHHLGRDFVDESDYPANCEYILYSHKYKFNKGLSDENLVQCTYPGESQSNSESRIKEVVCETTGKVQLEYEVAFMSHCPNRHPDFQQLVELDEVPRPLNFKTKQEDSEANTLYKTALERGVIAYLVQIQTGGRPSLKRDSSDPVVCLDPLSLHEYDAVSWSDQGSFTGDMVSIKIKFKQKGKRWFDGSKINLGYDKKDLPMYFDCEGNRKEYQNVEDQDTEKYFLE